MHLLRAADRAAVRWKNGGGSTQEIASYPPGATLDDFGWRISIADVAIAGPFSRFDGVDRVLTVLEGRLTLRFTDEARTVALGPGQPFAFAGDAAVEGAPVGGMVRDLNVMVRRGQWRAQVDWWRPDLPAGAVRIAIATARQPGLDPLDALLLDPDEQPPLTFTGYLVRLARLT